MRRALELAQLGWGRVQPNPLVGAVVIRDGVIVGAGHHQQYGGAHAEVEALRAAGAAARGATLYVTLEPCAHHGKTPPCVDAIINAGIATVVYAAVDPNTSARGGAERLRAAGVAVHEGVERAAARALNAAYFFVHERGAPYVALKLAISLDGRIAERTGQRTTITGAAAGREVQRLRAGYDAILVGRNTAAIDDPLLTVRDSAARVPPVRIVIDSDARLDAGSRLVQTTGDAPLWVVMADDADRTRAEALAARGVTVLRVPRAPDGLDITNALRELAARGINTILAEGGARIATSLLNAQQVQRMYLFVAPRLLGGAGVPAFTDSLRAPLEWRLLGEHRFGEDVLIALDLQETV